MADETTRLLLEIIGKDRGAKRTLTQVGEAAENASDEVRNLDDTVVTAGKHFDDTGKDAKTLDTEIVRVRKSIVDLAREIDRSPDNLPLFRQLSKEQSSLRKLERTKAILTDLLPGEDEGKQRGRLFSKGFIGRVVSDVGAFGTKIATSIATNIPGAIGGALKALPAPAQTAIVGGIVAAIVAGASFIGAAVAGAVVGGLGSGVIAAGVVLAFQDARIQKAGKDLGTTVLGGLKDAAGVFVGPTLRSIEIVRNAFLDLQPDIKRAFAAVAPATETLTRGLVGFIRNALPGLNRALERSRPLIEAIARGSAQLGAAIGQFFDDISSQGAGAKVALADLFSLIAGTVVVTGKLLAELSKVYFTGSVLAKSMRGDVLGVVKLFRERAVDAVKPTEDLAGALGTIVSPMTEVTGSAGKAAPAVLSIGDAMRQAATPTGLLADEMSRLNNQLLSVEEARSNVEEGIDNLTAAVKENGKSLDLGTEKGRNNAAAFRDLAQTALQSAEDTYKAKVATGDFTGAQKAANDVLTRAKNAYIENRTAITGNRTEAKKLADQIFGTPKQWKTTFDAVTAAASAKITGLAKQVKNLKGKTITIHTKFTSSGEHISGGIGSGTQVKGASVGGPVNEPGPKGVDRFLRRVAHGEHIFTASDVDAMGGQAEVSKFRKSLHGGAAATVQQFKSAPRQSFAAAQAVHLTIATTGRVTTQDDTALATVAKGIRTGRLQLKAGNARVVVGTV